MRGKLRSYKDEESGRHSVDWHEWRVAARDHLVEHNITDPQIWAAFNNSEAGIVDSEAAREREVVSRRMELIQS